MADEEVIELNESANDAATQADAQPLVYLIADDLRSAIDYAALFGVNAVVEACPVFDTESETERVGVSLAETRFELNARRSLQEYLTYRIVRYKTVEDASAIAAFNAIDELKRLTEFLSTVTITQSGRTFVVDSITSEPIDQEQLIQRLLYCGTIDVTLTEARG